ncbi:hypothetical protein [Tindallia californiensis]|uniref:Uncharacterized protein n=1 Tax=Tindallia californiensis TaxID=159292 RepID=A0A1H3R041_9FIRM|nr:hypothetical protein [Tindallia californiensis]SDZ18711.1 hypothetical protein SAMN05192546_11142 [Tindallia californiensis]
MILKSRGSFGKILLESLKIEKTYEINSRVVIEILSISEQEVFGNIGKLGEISKSNLRRFRNRENRNEKIRPEVFQQLLEDFTYFYINHDIGKTSILSNSSAPKLASHFRSLLIDEHCEINEFKLVPIKIDDISATLRNFKKLFSVSYTYAFSGYNDTPPKLKDIFSFSQGDLEKVSVHLDIVKDSASRELLLQLADNPELESEFSNLLLKGTLEDNPITQTVDLIEKSLTKRIAIELTDDMYENENLIKKALKDELFRIAYHDRNSI